MKAKMRVHKESVLNPNGQRRLQGIYLQCGRATLCRMMQGGAVLLSIKEMLEAAKSIAHRVNKFPRALKALKEEHRKVWEMDGCDGPECSVCALIKELEEVKE